MFKKMTLVTNKFSTSVKASVAIEFAIILPVCLFIFIETFNVCMLVLVQNKVVRLAAALGDTIARQDTSKAALNSLLTVSNAMVKPFDFSQGKIVISQVRNSNASTDPTKAIISWQETYQGGVSRFGTTGQKPNSLNWPANLTIISEQTVIVTEVFLTYKPLITSTIVSTKNLYAVNFSVPRVGTMNSLL